MRKTAAFIIALAVTLTLSGCADRSSGAVGGAGQEEARKAEASGPDESAASFSCEEVLRQYGPESPGAKQNGFHNVSGSEVRTSLQAIDRARGGCTVEYDAEEVSYDDAEGI